MNQLTIHKFPENDYFVQSELDRLRVNIGFLGADKKIIMITSSVPNEGKSFISVNIWAELAESGKRVCLVDTDMRKSNLRTDLQIQTNLEEFVGLSHYLAGKCEADDVIYSTNRPNAYMIPTITMINPSLLFEGNRFGDLLQKLRTEYDYVILDTPPLQIVSDGQLIAGKCDGCILVVRAHTTSRTLVKESALQLNRVDCPLLGIVLNRMEQKNARGIYRKTYYHSYYRSNTEKA